MLTEELPIFSTKSFRLRITIDTQMVSFTVADGISQNIAIAPCVYIAGADIRIFPWPLCDLGTSAVIIFISLD